MTVKTAGGRTGRKVPTLKIPGMPKLPPQPRMPTIKGLGKAPFPSVLERKQQTIAQIQKEDRYLLWQTQNPYGNAYDFLIHDYLLYERKLAPSEFGWLVDVGPGITADYLFPSRQSAWVLASRQGQQVRLQTASPIRDQALSSSGLHVISLFVENLSQNAKATLDAAWAGVQKA